MAGSLAPGAFPNDTQESRGTTIGNDTQNTQQPMAPPPVPPGRARRSTRRESTFQAAHPFQPSVPDSESQEPTISEDNRVFTDIELTNARIEALKDDHQHVRITFSDNYWLNVEEASDEGTSFYTLRVGQNRTEGNVTREVTNSSITNAEHWIRQARDDPQYWYDTLIEVMVALRDCGFSMDADWVTSQDKEAEIKYLQEQLDQALNAGDEETHAFRDRIRRLEATIERLRGKGKAVANAPASFKSDPAYQILAKERDILANERSDLKIQVEELRHKLAGSADISLGELTQLRDELTAEADEARLWHTECKKAREQADRYYSTITVRNEEITDLTKDLDDANSQVNEIGRENKDLLSRLLKYEPNYKPYTFLRHERDIPHPTTEGPYATRRSAYTPLPTDAERAAAAKSTTRATPITRTTPAATFPQMNNFLPGHVGTHTPAPTNMSSIGTHIKLPEVEVFKGSQSQGYERWRRLVIAKCKTYHEEDQRISYLETRIADEAWRLIEDLNPSHFMDYIDVLDELYMSYDKEAEAETQLHDGSLRQKSGEAFVAWKARFLACMRTLGFKDHTAIYHARQNLRKHLALAATSGSFKDETITQFLNRAQHLDMGHQQIANAHSDSKQTPRTSTHSATPRGTGPRVSFAGNSSNNRHTERKVIIERSDKDKKRLAELGLCFKCGGKHQMRHPNAPCRGKPFTRSSDIAELRVMSVMDDDASDYDPNVTDDEDVPIAAMRTMDPNDNDDVDDDGYLVDQSGN